MKTNVKKYKHTFIKSFTLSNMWFKICRKQIVIYIFERNINHRKQQCVCPLENTKIIIIIIGLSYDNKLNAMITSPLIIRECKITLRRKNNFVGEKSLCHEKFICLHTRGELSTLLQFKCQD